MEQIQMKHVLRDHTFLSTPSPRDLKHSWKISRLRQWIGNSFLLWDVGLTPIQESRGDSVNCSLDISCKLFIFPQGIWVCWKGMKSVSKPFAKVFIFQGLHLVNEPLLEYSFSHVISMHTFVPQMANFYVFFCLFKEKSYHYSIPLHTVHL